jgi:two-component system phosphate regulon response regulator PhoB
VLTVLVVDDEPHILDLIRATLEDERIRVIGVPDGEAALAQAAALAPDVVFLDVNLPDISGFDVCRLLREEPGLAGAKIVMLTAATRPADVNRGLAAGACQYLTKPFSPVRLLSLVDSLIPRSSIWMRD